MSRPFKILPEELLRTYAQEGLRSKEIAKLFNCSQSVIHKNIKAYNINLSVIKWTDNRHKVWYRYRASAKTKKRAFEFSQEEFFELIIKPCVYCGRVNTSHSKTKSLIKEIANSQEFFKYTGIDRIDSSKGYSKENCVPCCSTCNYAKRDLSIEIFKQWIEALVSFNAK